MDRSDTKSGEVARLLPGNVYQGEIHIAGSSTARWALILSVVAVFVLVGLLVLGSYTRREKVEGVLVPERGVAFAVARSAGVLTELLVEEGDRVKAGDALALITTDIKNEDVGFAGEVIATLLDEQIEQVALRKKTAAAVADAKALELSAHGKNIQAQIAALKKMVVLKHEIKTKKLQVLSANERLLNKGYISIQYIEQLRIELLDLEAEVRQLDQRILELNSAFIVNTSESRQLAYQLRLEELAMDDQVLDLKKSQAQNKASSSVVLTAPRDSVVSSILMRPGQSVSAGKNILALIPTEGVLEAELRVPNKSAGFIVLGQRLLFQYEAYPYQKFGLGSGSVRQVAQNAQFSGEGAEVEAKHADEEGTYKVRATLDSQTINIYQVDTPLKPGMKFVADILLERRSFLEWLFEPLFAWRARVEKSGDI